MNPLKKHCGLFLKLGHFGDSDLHAILFQLQSIRLAPKAILRSFRIYIDPQKREVSWCGSFCSKWGVILRQGTC